MKVELVYDVEVRESTVRGGEATDLDQRRGALPPVRSLPARDDDDSRSRDGSPNWRGNQAARGRTAARRTHDLRPPGRHDDLQLPGPGAGKGNAVWACDSKTGDCTDFHSVFIGICRWRGIPADHVFGLPLPPEKSEGDIKHCHCWAQFWVKDVGWIPIDASRANKFPKDRDYYFGTLGQHLGDTSPRPRRRSRATATRPADQHAPRPGGRSRRPAVRRFSLGRLLQGPASGGGEVGAVSPSIFPKRFG